MPDYSNYIGPVGNISTPEGYSSYVDPETNVTYQVPTGTDVSAPTAPPKRSEVQQRADALRILNRTMGPQPEAPGPNELNPFLKFDLQSRDYIRRRQAVEQAKREGDLWDTYNKGMSNRERALNTILTSQGVAAHNANEAEKNAILERTRQAGEKRYAAAEAKAALEEKKYKESLAGQQVVQEQMTKDYLRGQEIKQGLPEGTLTNDIRTSLSPKQIRELAGKVTQEAGGKLSPGMLVKRMQEELGQRYALAEEKGLNQPQTSLVSILRELGQSNPEVGQAVLSQFAQSPFDILQGKARPRPGSEEEFFRAQLETMSPEDLATLVQLRGPYGQKPVALPALRGR